jgi:hypothetical protein
MRDATVRQRLRHRLRFLTICMRDQLLFFLRNLNKSSVPSLVPNFGRSLMDHVQTFAANPSERGFTVQSLFHSLAFAG